MAQFTNMVALNLNHILVRQAVFRQQRDDEVRAAYELERQNHMEVVALYI